MSHIGGHFNDTVQSTKFEVAFNSARDQVGPAMLVAVNGVAVTNGMDGQNLDTGVDMTRTI